MATFDSFEETRTWLAHPTHPVFAVDTDVVATPMRWYRTRAGKVLHLSAACTGMRSKPIETPVPVMDVDTKVCDRCFHLPSGCAVAQYLAAVGEVVDALRNIRNDLSTIAGPDVGAATRLGAVAARLRLARPAAEAAGTGALDALDAAAAEAAALRAQLGDLSELVLRAAAALAMDMPLHIDLLRPAFGSNQAPEVASRLKSILLREVRRGRDPKPALQHAWAHYEPDTHPALHHWADTLVAELEVRRGRAASQVVFGPRSYARTPPSGLGAALWDLFAPDGVRRAHVMPSYVVDALRRATGMSSSWAPQQAGPASEEDTAVVLDTASDLERNGSDPAGALAWARLVHAFDEAPVARRTAPLTVLAI